MPVIDHTSETFGNFIAGHYSAEDEVLVMTQVLKWVSRGDGVAIYQNSDLGYPEVGDIKLASYGSPRALLEVDVPPTTLPDIGGHINFRYQLIGTYKS
jgi:hypothetical protein